MTSPRVSDESERMSAGQDGEPRPCLNVPGFLTQITDQPLDYCQKVEGGRGGGGDSPCVQTGRLARWKAGCRAERGRKVGGR